MGVPLCEEQREGILPVSAGTESMALSLPGHALLPATPTKAL